MKFFQLFSIAALALVSSTEAVQLDKDHNKQHYVDKNFNSDNFQDILKKNRVVFFGELSSAASKGLLEFLTGAGYEVYVINVDQQANQSSHKIEHWLEDTLKTKHIDYPQVYIDGKLLGGEAKVRDQLHHGVLFKNWV